MSITSEDIQKARRISRAIQSHLEAQNKNGLRSTDVYPHLAKNGLVEKDRHQGLFFRRFLRKLVEYEVLSQLIPQCKFQYGVNGMMEWYFYPIRNKAQKEFQGHSRTLIVPIKTDEEIEDLITKSKKAIDQLPSEPSSELTPQQLELRGYYSRAFAPWSAREVDFMWRAYKAFGKIEMVAKLLRRQPHIIRDRIEREALGTNHKEDSNAE